jgi:PTS system ascorbate-specific IIC component
MSFLHFIVNDVLGQASILISLIAMIGLIALKKSPGQIITGTLKTLLGFLVLLSGAGIIVNALTFLGEIFQKGFNMRGVVTDVGSIAGIAQQTLGRETALIMVLAFIVNILIARLTRFKYIFLTGQASLWMATVCSVIGYMGGLRGAELIITGGVIAGVMAVGMPVLAQPIVRKITGSDDFALGHFCTIGYIVQAGVAKVTGDVSKSTEDFELPQAFSFLQDTYLSMMVVMIPIYLIPAAVAGPAVIAPYANSVNYFKQSLKIDPKDDKARKNLRMAQKKLQQNQQNQDKNKNKDKDDQKKKQDKQQPPQKQPQPPKERQQQTNNDQLLKAMQNEEKNTRDKVNRRKAQMNQSRQSNRPW